MKYIELTPLLEKLYDTTDTTTIHSKAFFVNCAHEINARIYSEFAPMFRQQIRVIYNETNRH